MVNFPALLLDHFRCSQCYSALSVGPIRCGPDGAPVCGRCPASPRDVPNPPLQALLARYAFPCRYSAKGCEQFLVFGDEHHEQVCQFQEAEIFDDAFETIDPLVMQNFKCFDCEKFLSVVPLKLTAEGKSICGRCVDRWEGLHTKEVLVRNWKMEFLIKKFPIQCSYYKEGCKRVLNWGQVQGHEDFCPFRLYNCPATPHDSCQAVLPAANLFQHFQRQHPALILEIPKFQQSLRHDSDTHRLLKLDEKLYLIMTKTNVASNRLWLSVSHIGDVDTAKHLKYTLSISNTEENDHFPSRLQPIQPDLVLRINEETSVPTSFDGLRTFFRQPNLQDVVCNISVSQEGSPPRTPMLKVCKWEGCKQIGEEGRMVKHEEGSCQEREAKCKWSRCNFKMLHRLLARHENICLARIVSCKWAYCKYELPASQMGSHELKCGEGKVRCRFLDCRIECSGRDWDRHVIQCDHRYEGTYWCETLGCKRKPLPPSALARHVLTYHPAHSVTGATVTKQCKRGARWDNDVHLQYDGLLFWGNCKFLSDGHVEFYVWLYGGVAFQAEYKYAIKVFHPSNLHQTITREDKCSTWIKISADILVPFVQNNEIKFELTIIKK